MMQTTQISVDLTEVSRKLIHVQVKLPVQSDSVAVFTTPLWIPESHRSNGPISSIAGLHFSSARGTPLRWRRISFVVSEYFVVIPAGVVLVHAAFDAIVTRRATRRTLMLCWESVLLHHARQPIDRIPVHASISVPGDWGDATALQSVPGTLSCTSAGNTKTLRYHPTSIERLQDSPVLAGLHFREFAVTTDRKHLLCVAADTEECTQVPQATLSKLAKLVEKTQVAFGSRHYATFRFLITLTAHEPGPFGAEHHESFDASLPRKALSSAEGLDKHGSVIAHEFAHSWNGKYRRPTGQVARDFSTPLDGSLLWVYEGLTQYYEGVLSVRSGIMSPSTYRAELARQVAWLEGQSGRLWRSTEDTGTGVNLNPIPAWASWMRRGDYYYEGALLWLDVDTLIRTRSGFIRSLDDFARGFFGQGRATGPEVVPYTLDDLVLALTMITPYDWLSFFRERVLDVAPEGNIGGVDRSGYRFFYTNEPGAGQDTEEAMREAIWNSIGVKVTARPEGGLLDDVRRSGPADEATLATGQTIVKVAGSAFSLEKLAAEIAAKREGIMSAIRLTITHEDETWEVELDCHSGLRHPQLERRYGTIDLLSFILERKG